VTTASASPPAARISFDDYPQALFTPRRQYDPGATSGQVTGGAFTKAAAGAGNNYNFAADVVAHGEPLTREAEGFCVTGVWKKALVN
jgi:hypothetical protein